MAHPVLAIFRWRFFNCLTILLLVLCLATLALWVRSYWRADVLYHRSNEPPPGGQTFGLRSTFGELTVFTVHFPPAYPDKELGWHLRAYPSSADHTIARFAVQFPQGRPFHFLGFGFGRAATPDRTIRYVFPHWFIALLFATLPALKLRSLLRTRRRHRAGLCHHCGYDLRATPPDSRCPECGHVPASPRLTAPHPS